MRGYKDQKYKGIITYKTGEVTHRAGANKETVRYYEQRELIPKPYRVLEAEASYDTGKTTIKYDQSKTNQEHIITAIDNTGFTVNTKSSN